MEQQILQLKITLDEISPPIWRRVLVSNNEDLYDLHIIIQILFKWEGYHLHEFKIKNLYYGEPDEEFDLYTIHNEFDYIIKDFNFKAGSKFSYIYDFGDNWKHTILVEKVLPFDKAQTLPYLVSGKRAAPPENVGGPWMYEKFLEFLKNPDDSDYKDTIGWNIDDFDPEFFHRESIEYWLYLLYRKQTDWQLRRNLLFEDPEGWLPMEVAFDQFYTSITSEDLKKLSNLQVCEDINTLLNYIQKNNPTGTSSKGNFPQKAVKEIAALLADPPQLEIDLGKRSYTLKNEYEVWPVFFLHLLAFNAYLIDGGKSKRWNLTELGEEYQKSPILIQYFLLFTNWWFHGDWRIIHGECWVIETLPPSFQRLIHYLLISAEPGRRVHFDDFCHIIKRDLGYDWDSDFDDRYMWRFSFDVERMIIRPLESFGVIKTDRKSSKLSEIHLPFSTFQLTSLGRKILASFSVGYKELPYKNGIN
jgi:hypothetical protein